MRRLRQLAAYFVYCGIFYGFYGKMKKMQLNKQQCLSLVRKIFTPLNAF